jgi:RNA polymerase sigma-70 factor, ECF subfamily
MVRPPTTRVSLIARLAVPEDRQAWDEFVDIYMPLVYRLARAKGMQPADAEDLGQEVLISVAGAIRNWEPDPQRGRFRDWLYRIAVNGIVDHVRRRKHTIEGTGRSDVHRKLAEIADVFSGKTDELALEYRRQVFQWAAKKVSSAVSTNSWEAFRLTAVEGHPIWACAGVDVCSLEGLNDNSLEP